MSPGMCRSQKSGRKINRFPQQNKISRPKIYCISLQNHLVKIQYIQDPTTKHKSAIQYPRIPPQDKAQDRGFLGPQNETNNQDLRSPGSQNKRDSLGKRFTGSHNEIPKPRWTRSDIKNYNNKIYKFHENKT